MKCKNLECQRELNEEFNVCPYCGTAIEKKRICPSCGTELPFDAVFCPLDGTRLQKVRGKRVVSSDNNKDVKKQKREITIRRETSPNYDDWCLNCYVKDSFGKRWICSLNRASEYFKFTNGSRAFLLIIDGKHKYKTNGNFGEPQEIQIPEDYNGDVIINWDWWHGMQLRLNY